MPAVVTASVGSAKAEKRLGAFSLNALGAIVGAALLGEPTLGEGSARVFSLIAALLPLATTLLLDQRVSNWALWLFTTYFALFEVGNLAGMIAFGIERSVLDYPTTFSDVLTLESKRGAYLVSGITACVLGAVFALWPTPQVRRLPPSSERLERWARWLVLLTAPLCAAIYILDARRVASLLGELGYAAQFSAEFRGQLPYFPLRAVWTNLNLMGFYLWFASVPKERTFRWMGPLFVLLAFLNALKGGRILVLMPIAFIIWYRAYVFRRDRLNLAVLGTVGAATILFAFAVELLRQEVGGAGDALVGFFVFSVSKAQHVLALFLEHRDELGASSNFWAAPLRFPLTYLLHGSDVVGQSLVSAPLRGDLGHVLSAAINMPAYVAGGGTGSSLTAEAYEFGLLGLVPLLLVFFALYRWFFASLDRRPLLLLSPLVFQHLVFSPRDNMFPNTWGAVKPLAAIVVAYLLIGLFDALERYEGQQSRPVTEPAMR